MSFLSLEAREIQGSCYMGSQSSAHKKAVFSRQLFTIRNNLFDLPKSRFRLIQILRKFFAHGRHFAFKHMYQLAIFIYQKFGEVPFDRIFRAKL